MHSIHRPILLITALLLASCQAMDDPIPTEIINNLVGVWQQVDGKTTVRFYDDESVKLIVPDETPPIKVLSTLETMKDNKLAFSIGDRWTGPIRIETNKDWQSLVLIFPGDNTERKVTFVRVQE